MFHGIDKDTINLTKQPVVRICTLTNKQFNQKGMVNSEKLNIRIKFNNENFNSNEPFTSTSWPVMLLKSPDLSFNEIKVS